MTRSGEKLDRAAAPRRQNRSRNEVRRARPVRSRIEGKLDRAFARETRSAATSRRRQNVKTGNDNRAVAFGWAYHARTWDSAAFRGRSDPTGGTQRVPGHDAAEDSDGGVHARGQFSRIGAGGTARCACRRGRVGALTGGSRRA